MAKAKKIKKGYEQSQTIKVYFKSVGRFYPVTREKLAKLQAAGKLEKGIEGAMFEPTKEELDKLAKSKAKADAAEKAKADAAEKAKK